MTPTELMAVRYKVIADYPNNPYSVGWIMEYVQQGHPLSEKGWEKLFSPYPHLFKKLQWWEDREEKDMPQYLKYITNGKVYKVVSHKANGFNIDWHNWNLFYYEHSLPATEEEFNNQNK